MHGAMIKIKMAGLFTLT